MKRANIFLDDSCKKISRLNKNYYFAVTALILLLNITLHILPIPDNAFTDVRPEWHAFSVANLLQALINSYTHANWQHCLLNMLCFLVAGTYLERKQGSLLFFAFLFILSFFTAFASCTNALSLNWHGFSGINYGLYGYIIIDYIFLWFHQERRDRFNSIAGAVILALIYFAMCFDGGTSTVSFTWFPYDLLRNLGHASGFVVGIAFGLYDMIVYAVRRHPPVQTENET